MHHTDTHPKMSNVNMSDDPIKSHELDRITSAGSEDKEEYDVEEVLGSVHISKPSIQHVFFLLRPILKPVLERFNKVEHELNELVNSMKLERVFLDRPVAISQNVPYTVDFKGRKYLYLLNNQGFSMVVNGQLLPADLGKWTPIMFPAGTLIYANGVNDASPLTVTIRACDTPMSLFMNLLSGSSVSLAGGVNNIGNVGFIEGLNDVRQAKFHVAVPATATALVVSATPGFVSGAVVTATGAANLTITDGNGDVLGVVPSTATVGQYFPMNMPAATSITANKSATTPAVTLAYSS